MPIRLINFALNSHFSIKKIFKNNELNDGSNFELAPIVLIILHFLDNINKLLCTLKHVCLIFGNIPNEKELKIYQFRLS